MSFWFKKQDQPKPILFSWLPKNLCFLLQEDTDHCSDYRKQGVLATVTALEMFPVMESEDKNEETAQIGCWLYDSDSLGNHIRRHLFIKLQYYRFVCVYT